MRRWLREQPDRPETRWARAELHAVIGELDEARGVIDRMEVADASDRFEQQVLRSYVEWLSGADPDFDELTAMAETVGEAGSTARLTARGLARIAAARDRAVRGGDWMAPLIEIREMAGAAAAADLLREDVWLPRFRRVLLFGGPVRRAHHPRHAGGVLATATSRGT